MTYNMQITGNFTDLILVFLKTNGKHVLNNNRLTFVSRYALS